jgi:hypothetical protein
VLSTKITLVAGWKSLVPTTTPIIIEIAFHGVRLGRNARIVPQKVPTRGFPYQIINLGSHPGQDADAKPVVF